MSASTSKNQGATSAAHRLQPRTQGGKFAPKTVPLVYKTDTVQAAIELSQNPEALRLAGELATKCAEATKLRGECNVLQNALGESRKISQEREKQLKDSLQRLTEEQRLHGLSRMSDANARGSLSQLHAELGGDPDQPALEKVQRLIARLDAEKTFCATYQADCGRFTGLLSRISTALPYCAWDELPLAVESLLQRCNQYGERSDRLGAANTQSQAKIKELEESLKIAIADVEGTEYLDSMCTSLGTQLHSADARLVEIEAENESLEAQLRDLTPLLPLWMRVIAVAIGLLCVAFVAHRAGFSAAIALQGGAR